MNNSYASLVLQKFNKEEKYQEEYYTLKNIHKDVSLDATPELPY